MAARDYVVFEPNYRGSDNLGNAYQRAIYNDAGDGPGRDVMAGVEAVKKLGFVDESKIAVTGWSYGGYMTSWLIGHYHIWKTAVSGRRVHVATEEYNLSDFNVSVRYSFKGSPWMGSNMKDYVAQSSHHLRVSDQDADPDPKRYRRRARPHHAVLPAVPCLEGQRSNGEVRSLPRSRTLSRRPRTFAGCVQPMAGLAGPVPEVAELEAMKSASKCYLHRQRLP